MKRKYQAAGLPAKFDTGGIVGIIEIIGCVWRHRSEWFHGPFDWAVAHARRPPSKPRQGQFNFFTPYTNGEAACKHSITNMFTHGIRVPYRSVFSVLVLALLSGCLTANSLNASPRPQVTVTDNGRSWTLDNGIVKAVIDKRNGDMNSLFYKGIDTMGHDQGQSGYWEQDPSAAAAAGRLDGLRHH